MTDHEGVLYTASDSVLYKSQDGGLSWQRTASQPLIDTYFTRLFSYKGYLYVGSTSKGVFRSSNGGQSWENFNTGLEGAIQYITDFCAHGDSLFTGTSGSGVFFLNLANAPRWQPYNEELFQLGVDALLISGSNMFASSGAYVFMRPLDAANWKVLQIDSKHEQQSALRFITAGNFVYAGTYNGLFRGLNDGSDWKSNDIEILSHLPVESFAIDGKRLFAGVRYKLEHFICSSDDDGETWTVRAHEFAQLLDMVSFNGKLFAIRSDGVWYMPFSIWTDIENSPETAGTTFRLHQNYPNPFNPSTSIRYNIPVSSHVTLKVYDVLGKESVVLVNETQSAGSYEIPFHATGLTSGVYLYELQAGSFREVKKLVLMK